MSIDFKISAPVGEVVDRETLAKALKREFRGLKPNGTTGNGFLFHGMEVALDYEGAVKKSAAICNRIYFAMHGSQSDPEKDRCLRLIDHVTKELGWVEKVN